MSGFRLTTAQRRNQRHGVLDGIATFKAAMSPFD